MTLISNKLYTLSDKTIILLLPYWISFVGSSIIEIEFILLEGPSYIKPRLPWWLQDFSPRHGRLIKESSPIIFEMHYTYRYYPCQKLFSNIIKNFQETLLKKLNRVTKHQYPTARKLKARNWIDGENFEFFQPSPSKLKVLKNNKIKKI